jgi:hypothetical protein
VLVYGLLFLLLPSILTIIILIINYRYYYQNKVILSYLKKNFLFIFYSGFFYHTEREKMIVSRKRERGHLIYRCINKESVPESHQNVLCFFFFEWSAPALYHIPEPNDAAPRRMILTIARGALILRLLFNDYTFDDSATWYSTHTCSTLLRFNCKKCFHTKFLLSMRPVHVWRSRTPDGVRCAHFPSVITTI